MRSQVETLKGERKALVDQGAAILERAEKENRPMTADENGMFERIHAEAAEKADEAKRLEAAYVRQRAAEDDLNRSAGRRTAARGERKRDPSGAMVLRHGRRLDGKAKLTRIRAGSPVINRCSPEYRDSFISYLGGQSNPQATLQTDIGSSGGYLAPEQFNAELIKELDDILWMRKLSRTFMIDAPSLGTPYRSARVSSVTRGAELATPTADTAYKLGKRTLTPHYMAGQVNVSRDLMRSAAMPVMQIVTDEIKLEVGYFEESEFMIGSGAALTALGIFTADASGIPTSRDVTAASQTQWDADILRTAKYTLRQQYRSSPSLAWVIHRDSVSQIAKLKDGDSNYLWRPGISFGEPDNLLNIPVRESEFAPNTFTTGSYVGVLGDFNFYWIVDGMGLEIQRLIETGAGANQDQFIYRRKMDAGPVLADAFVRIKLA